MNRMILFVLPLGLLLASCVSQAPLFIDSQVGNRTLSISGCTTYAGPMPTCDNDANYPKAEINLDTFDVKPQCIKAKKGKKIKFTLTSASDIERGSVVLFPEKVDNVTWIIASNFPNKNKITITVPTEKQSGAPFPEGNVKYGILTSTNCLDPRIHIIR